MPAARARSDPLSGRSRGAGARPAHLRFLEGFLQLEAGVADVAQPS